MNTLEAPAPILVTRSLVSDWVGDPVSAVSVPADAMPNDDKVLPDFHQLTERMIDLDEVYNLTPTLPLSKQIRVYRPLRVLQARLFHPLLKMYEAFSYDSIDVTISISDPKNLAGGVHIGWFPYRPVQYFVSGDPGDQEYELQNYFSQNAMTEQHLLMAPTTVLVPYGLSDDVKFNIPWQYNTTHIHRSELQNNAGTQWKGVTGEPILFTSTLTGKLVTSVATYLPRLRIFVRFNGLRFLCPNYQNSFTLQMDPVGTAVVLDTIATVGAEVVSSFVSSSDFDTPSVYNDGTFESPTAVQLSYAGDSTSMGPPAVSPTFSSFSQPGLKHSISDFLQRPAFITEFFTGEDIISIYANPFNPLNEAPSASPCTTWFNYFGMMSSYWRGTLVFDFVILGHPLVEIGYKINTAYPVGESFGTSSNSFSESSVMEGVCKGVHRVRVPVPWGMPTELACNDHSVLNSYHVPAAFFCNFKVVSTMLDVTPVIPIALYMSAMEDFQFYWPSPPGLYEIGEALQVRLPQVSTEFQTRAKTLNPVGDMFHPLKYVEDYFRYWCRVLPYIAVDSNDEPIPNARYACFPAFGNPTESAAWTPDVNNSWYICQDYLSMLSSIFLYFRGTIGLKAVCVPTDTADIAYKYMALRPYVDNRYEVHNPFTSSPLISPPEANFGVGAIITPSDKQPVLEFTLPFLSPLAWLPVWFANQTGIAGDSLHFTLNTNLRLIQENGDLADALFRKGGPDYSLAVETLPPNPYLWRVRGGNWS